MVLVSWAVGYLVNNTGYSKGIEHFQNLIIQLKYTLEQAMKAQRGSRGTALLFH